MKSLKAAKEPAAHQKEVQASRKRRSLALNRSNIKKTIFLKLKKVKVKTLQNLKLKILSRPMKNNQTSSY